MRYVYDVINNMNSNSAPDPDGFNGLFYSFCWDIIKQDLFEAISEFFVGGELPKAWTSTYILSLPKVENPTTIFKQFRRISLCNFCNKIISKLLMVILSIILPTIISMEQGGFVKGRLINDDILLAHELIQSIKKKVKGSNIIRS